MSSLGRVLRHLLTILHDVGAVVGGLVALSAAVYYFAPYITRSADVVFQTLTGFDLMPYVKPIPPLVQVLVSITFGLLLLILLLLLRRLVAYRRRVRHVAEEFRECLRIHLCFVKDVNEILESRIRNKREVLAEKFRDHSTYLCARISEMFEILARSKCHTTIKSFDPATGVVKTRARDGLMHNRDRSQADEGSTAFLFDDHTAFSNILVNPRRYMFLSNHLLLRSLFRGYTNKNPDWRGFYRATVVVPITAKRRASEINKNSVLGFITVDSRRGHFTKSTSRLILSLFTELLFDSMVNLGLGWKEDEL